MSETGDQALSTIWYLMALVLVGSALVSRRLPAGGAIRMALTWVAIFVGLLALYKLGERQGLFSARFGNAPAVAEQAGSDQAGTPADMPGSRTSGGMLRIPVSPDGHYWVEGTINGTAARFLIDSGATMTALSQGTARAAGLSIEPGAPGMMMTTANGQIEVRRSSIAVLAVGPVRATDLPVAVSATFGEVNVIGMNLLSQLKSWGVQDGEMVLTP
ncbi:MAG: TIGR02281 family clan AA aspartic protease [Sphingobium sp.]